MRQEVIDLKTLGPVPSSEQAIEQDLREEFDRYEKLISAILKPVTDEEARVLVTLFGPDDGFGLAGSLVSLVESAPGWPLQDCLQNTENEWIQTLRQRIANARQK